MKFLDLFAGIGGFRMGMERAGHKCAGYVEIDKFARQSYQAIYNTEGEWTAHDITQVTNEEWGRFKGEVNCICGGFPCQSFSIAGKRKGFADETRGTLFFEIARAAKEIKPSYLFLENVKGLLNHDRGNTFRTILRTLDELGYDVEWQLCNSKNFGVPQNRERVIIIGHLRGASTREVFFDAGQDGQTTSSNEINDLLPVSAPRHGRRGTVLGTDGISSAIAATDYKLPKQIAVHQVGNISDNGTDNLRIRKITPLEAWRLQGFPDWAFDKAKGAGISNSQLYKQAGNSVTVPLMEFVAKRL